MNVGKRRSLLSGLAATMAVAGTALSSAPALASPPDPGSTDIPGLSWRGENLRFVVCDPTLTAARTVGISVQDWSGDPLHQPALVPGTVSLFTGTGDHAGQHCASGTFLGQSAGLAQIVLAAQNQRGIGVFSHTFLGGWMNLEKPSIAGGGDFNAGGPGREVTVTVKGDMPMNGVGGIAGSVVLPDDWATLARAMAVDANPLDATPWMRWDIHDDQSNDDAHAAGSGCTPASTDGHDAVDNCYGGGNVFSTIFGPSTGSAIGPFDPMRANETLLANGRLDAGDAPMPAARIDFTIAPNSGAAGDISGVGSWDAAGKPADYSRDGTGAVTAHNLYAPFGSEYIPATSAPGAESSGVAGPAAGTGFTGFLVNGQYTFWTKAYSLASAAGASTLCVQRGLPGAPVYRKLPFGDQSVVAYTDEHGEARMTYTPGTGAYYNNLGLGNADQGCDLNGVDVLGTSSITATARYPYMPQFRAPLDMTSDTLVARVHSRFSKTLAAYSRGTGADNAYARIVVAHAQDVDGSPLAGEAVCVMSQNANGFRPFFGITGTAGTPIDLAGSHAVADPIPGLGRLCIATNAQGNAAVEVFNGAGSTTNVIAEFVDEGLLRQINVPFGTAPDVPPGSTVVQQTITEIHNTYTTSTGGSGNGSTGSGSGSSGSSGSTGTQTTATKVVKLKLAMARLVRPVHGAPYIVLRVSGPSGKKATVHFKLYGANHVAKGSFTRSLAVNKTVKVTHPKLS